MILYKITMTNLRRNKDFSIVILASTVEDAEQQARLSYQNGAYRLVAIETLEELRHKVFTSLLLLRERVIANFARY